jgi:hypothetical protein
VDKEKGEMLSFFEVLDEYHALLKKKLRTPKQYKTLSASLPFT